MTTRHSALILGHLSLAVVLCQCAGEPRAHVAAPLVVAPPRIARPDPPAAVAAAPPAEPAELVPVVRLPPPPSDQFIKVHGRNLLLKRGRIVSDVNGPSHRPQVAERWRRRGVVHHGTYKVCVTTRGTVSSASTLRTAGNRVLDKAFSAAIETWRYQPTRLGPKPIPFCYRLAIGVSYAPVTPAPSDPAMVQASHRSAGQRRR